MIRALLVATLLASLLACWQWRESTASNARANVATGQRDAFAKALDDTTAARAKETKRADKLQEALDAAHIARQALEADVRRADAVAVSLRQRSLGLAAAARCPAANPTPAASGPPASAPADLLADMLGRIDEAAGTIGRHADESRIAGQLCERGYDALR